jgi:hypothetical protein
VYNAFLSFIGDSMSDESVKSSSKGDLIEKLIFGALPILLSCVAYLWSSFNDMSKKITILESKISIVVSPENKPIPPEGTTIAMEQLRADAAENRSRIQSDAALARADLDKRIALLEQLLHKR